MEIDKKTEMFAAYGAIKNANPLSSFALTGSFALYLQGVELPREPSDLDIRITMQPGQAEFVVPEGAEETTSSSDDYPVELSPRREFRIGDLKVDVFAIQKKKTEIKYKEGYPVVTPQSILQYKFDYAFDSSSPGPAVKHKRDLIFILERNTLIPNLSKEKQNLFD